MTNAAPTAAAITPVEALVQLARSSREDPPDVVLRTVAETVHQIAGFRSVVVNVFRPAWDDYLVEVVIDTPEGCAALDGTVNPAATFDRLFLYGKEEPRGVVFVDDARFWDEVEHSYCGPQTTRSEDPDAWDAASDGLFIMLRDANGGILGNLSIDEPVDGRRPTHDTLRLLRAIGSHAEHALDSARRIAAAAEMARIQAHVLASTSRLTACSTADALLRAACETIVPGLGFERVAAYGRGVRPGTLELRHTVGWGGRPLLPDTLPAADIELVLTAAGQQFGCWLLDGDVVFNPPASGSRSRRNGHGPLAWNDHCLLVPTCAPNGAMTGLFVIEDPVDHLLPADPRRRATRLLLDQVSAGLDRIDTHERLRFLASHDPLTGVHNRRNLAELLNRHDDVALLVCDLDDFKQINDRYGHEVGDRVLVRFGKLLRELARESDVAMRLGGEEFCLLLPHTGAEGALAMAERLRADTALRMQELVPGGVTVSVGVAVTGDGTLDARGLLSAADRGLYAAKAAGRNRVLQGC